MTIETAVIVCLCVIACSAACVFAARHAAEASRSAVVAASQHARNAAENAAKMAAIIEKMAIDASNKAMAVCDHELSRKNLELAERREDRNAAQSPRPEYANASDAPAFSVSPTFPEPAGMGV